MTEALRSEFPRLLADQLGDRSKDAALDGHLSMQLVIAVQATQALNREAKQHDATSVAIYAPSRNSLAVDFRRGATRDVEMYAFEFRRPQRAQIVRRMCDCHVESFDATSRVGKVWAGHGRSHAAAVTITPRPAHGHAVAREIRGVGHNSMLEVRILLTS